MKRLTYAGFVLSLGQVPLTYFVGSWCHNVGGLSFGPACGVTFFVGSLLSTAALAVLSANAEIERSNK